MTEHIMLPELPSYASADDSGAMLIDGIPAQELAERFDTPLYVYSANTIRANYRRLATALQRHLPGPYQILYAYKGNSNPAITRILHNEGAGAEVMSHGELYQALVTGIPPGRIVFNGMVKPEQALRLAIEANINMVSVDSFTELEMLQRLTAELQMPVRVAFRVKPYVRAGFHEFVATGHDETHFGIDHEPVIEAVKLALDSRWLQPVGLHTHIGSQICEIDPFTRAATYVFDFCKELHDKLGWRPELVDLGGGFGIQAPDRSRHRFDFDRLAHVLGQMLREYFPADAIPTLCFEPSRSMVGDACCLLGRVIAIKEGHKYTYVALDMGYATFARCMVYGAYHDIRAVKQLDPGDAPTYRVVGNICESGDVLGKAVPLPDPQVGDILALLDAGSYGYAMSSTYNGYPRPAEVLVDNGDVYLIRERESLTHLIGDFDIPPHLVNVSLVAD